MEKLDALPTIARQHAELPDELFDGDVWAVEPGELGYKNAHTLRSRLSRRDGIHEQLKRLGIERVATRKLDDGRLAVQAVRAAKNGGRQRNE